MQNIWDMASFDKRCNWLSAIKMTQKYIPQYANKSWFVLPAFVRSRLGVIASAMEENPYLFDDAESNPASNPQVEVGKEVYEKFHDFAPTKMYTVEVPQPKVLVKIGAFSAIGYFGDKWKFTHKKGKLHQKYAGRKGQHYIHEFHSQTKSDSGVVAFSPSKSDPEVGLLMAWKKCRLTSHGVEDL